MLNMNRGEQETKRSVLWPTTTSNSITGKYAFSDSNGMSSAPFIMRNRIIIYGLTVHIISVLVLRDISSVPLHTVILSLTGNSHNTQNRAFVWSTVHILINNSTRC